MQSEHYRDQPRVLVFFGRQTSKEEVDTIVNELCSRIMDVYVQAMPVEKMGEAFSKVSPQEIATVVLLTKNMESTPPLQEAIGRLSATNSAVIMYPTALPNVSPSARTVSTPTDLYRAVSEQWGLYISNRSFNRSKTNIAAGPAGGQPMPPQMSMPLTSPPSNIGGAYMMSAMGPPNAVLTPPQISQNLNVPMQAPPFAREEPIVIRILNQRADPQYNDLLNTLRSKYGGRPNVQFQEFSTMQELLAHPSTGGANMLIVGGKQAPMIANSLPELRNRGVHETFFYHPTMAVDPRLRQYFSYAVQDYPAMDKIMGERLAVLSGRAGSVPVGGVVRPISAPPVPLGNTMITSRILDHHTVHNITSKKIQGEQMGMVVGGAPLVSAINQVRTSQVMMAGSRGPLVRAASAETMRLNSVRRLERKGYLGSCMKKRCTRPMIYALDYADKTVKPSFFESLNYLGIHPAYHPIYDLNSTFKNNSIMIAPYDRRNDIKQMLGNPRNKQMSVVMFGQHLVSDPVVSHPQVELVTTNFMDIASYLQYRKVKINPTGMPHALLTHQEQTSIAVLPQPPMAPMMMTSTIAQSAAMAGGQLMHRPLSVIHEQNSALDSGMRPPVPLVNTSMVGLRTASPTSPLLGEAVQGAPVMVQRSSFTQIAPPPQSIKMLDQPLGMTISKPMVNTSVVAPSTLTHSFASVPPPPVLSPMGSPIPYAKEWIVKRNPQTPGGFFTSPAAATNQFVSNVGSSVVPKPISPTNMGQMPVPGPMGLPMPMHPSALNQSPNSLLLPGVQDPWQNRNPWGGPSLMQPMMQPMMPPPMPGYNPNQLASASNIPPGQDPWKNVNPWSGPPIVNAPNPWNNTDPWGGMKGGVMIGTDHPSGIAQRMTPQFSGPIGVQQMSPQKQNGEASEINITSNQSIIDQQLGPGVQSQGYILNKQTSMSNIPGPMGQQMPMQPMMIVQPPMQQQMPLQQPPTVMSNIMNQGPMVYAGAGQPIGGTRPMSRLNRNEAVEEAQGPSIISASEKSNDPSEQNEARIRRNKKKAKAPNQPNNDQLSAISEEEKRTSGVSNPSVGMSEGPSHSIVPTPVDIPFQRPPQMNQSIPNQQNPQMFNNVPNAQQNRPPETMPLYAPASVPPSHPYESPSRSTVDVQQNFNQPPKLILYQQTFNKEDQAFVKDPRQNISPTSNEYLSMTPAQVFQAPSMIPQSQQPQFSNPQTNNNPSWQKNGFEMWQGPPPSQSTQPTISKAPLSQQPETMTLPSTIPLSKPPSFSDRSTSPSQQPTAATKPAPAQPLHLPEVIDSTPSSLNNIHSDQEIPVINITESSDVRFPHQNYFPEKESTTTTATKYYPETRAPIAAAKALEPARRFANEQRNEYEMLPAYGSSNYRPLNDSSGKYTTSTTNEARDNYHIGNRNSIRISSNNLANTGRISHVSEPENSGDYDVRFENGIKIISRKHPRASSVDGSPAKVIHEYLGDSGGMRSSYYPVENRVSRNYIKYSSTPDSYPTQPTDYATATNQYYGGGSPQKVERISYMPNYQYQTAPIPMDSHLPRSRSLQSDYRTARPSGINETYGVLYMCPRSSNIIHEGLYKVCTPFDKIRMYTSNDELKLVKCRDYGAVVVFPLDERRLPETNEPNMFFVLMNTPSRNSKELAIKDLSELKQIAGRYHRAPIVQHAMKDYPVVEPVYRTSYRTHATPTPIVPTTPPIAGDYRVLLQEDLRRDVQLDAFIEAEHFMPSTLEQKMQPYTNYLIIVGQEEVESVRRFKKPSDKLLVLGRSYHHLISNVEMWTQDPRQIEEYARRALAKRRLSGSPTSITSGHTRPKVYYSFENPEVQEEVAAEFGEMVDTVKYYDYSSLLSKLKQNREDLAVVVINRSLLNQLSQLRSSVSRGRFLLYDRRGSGMDSYGSDVIETPTVSAVVRAVRSLL